MLFMVPQATGRRAENGYTLVPLELPGGPAREDEPDEAALKRVVYDNLSLNCRFHAPGWTYTPSPRHAVDRRANTSGQLAPLAETRRMSPADPQGAQAPRAIVARIYRGELLGEPGPQSSAALWLTAAALRAIVRGAPLADALALLGTQNQSAAKLLPANSLLYLPSKYGERYLLRAAAKYGHDALFGEMSPHADQ
jgi:hypothetical protein